MTIYKLGLLSDLHDQGGTRHADLQTAHAAMNAVGVDAKIWLGDMADSLHASWIRALFELVENTSTYVAMGGHDDNVNTSPNQTTSAATTWQPIAAEYQPSMTACGDFYVDFGNWRVIVLNNGDGYLTVGSWAWLTQLLASSTDKYIIICNHRSCCPQPADEGGFLYLPESTAMISLLSTNIANGIKIKLWLFGHGHYSSYNYQQLRILDGVTHFEITAPGAGANYGILYLHENGDFYLNGYGSQKSFFSAAAPGCRTFAVGTIGGDNTASLPFPYPRQDLGGIAAASAVGDMIVGDAVVMASTQPGWGAGTTGSIHHHANADGSYNTTMVFKGSTLRGTTQQQAQGKVFKITSVS